VPFLLILLAMLVVAPAPLTARQTPQTTDVTGTIVDARTRDPIAGAVVRFPRANRYTLTGDDGTFILRDVSPGVHEVFIHRIGYREQGYRFTVEPGRHYELELEPAPILLDGVEVVVGEDPAHEILDRAARSRAMGSPGGNPIFWSTWNRDAIEEAGFDDPMGFLTKGPPRIVIRPCVGLGLPADRLCVSPPFGGMRPLWAGGEGRVWGGRGGAGRMVTVFLDDRPMGPLEHLESFPMDLVHRVETYGDRGEQAIRLYTEGYLRLVAEGVIDPTAPWGPPEMFDDLVRERARLGLPAPGMPVLLRPWPP